MKEIAYLVIVFFFVTQIIGGLKRKEKDRYQKLEVFGAGLAVIGALVVVFI